MVNSQEHRSGSKTALPGSWQIGLQVRRPCAVGFVNQFLDDRPGEAAVQANAQPAVAADIGRDEEVLRVGGHQRLLRAGGGVAPDRDPAVLVMIVREHDKELALDAEGRSAPGDFLARFGKGQAELADAREPIVLGCFRQDFTLPFHDADPSSFSGQVQSPGAEKVVALQKIFQQSFDDFLCIFTAEVQPLHVADREDRQGSSGVHRADGRFQ